MENERSTPGSLDEARALRAEVLERALAAAKAAWREEKRRRKQKAKAEEKRRTRRRETMAKKAAPLEEGDRTTGTAAVLAEPPRATLVPRRVVIFNLGAGTSEQQTENLKEKLEAVARYCGCADGDVEVVTDRGHVSSGTADRKRKRPNVSRLPPLELSKTPILAVVHKAVSREKLKCRMQELLDEPLAVATKRRKKSKAEAKRSSGIESTGPPLNFLDLVRSGCMRVCQSELLFQKVLPRKSIADLASTEFDVDFSLPSQPTSPNDWSDAQIDGYEEVMNFGSCLRRQEKHESQLRRGSLLSAARPPSSPLDLYRHGGRGLPGKNHQHLTPRPYGQPPKRYHLSNRPPARKQSPGGKHVYSSPEPRESEISSSHSSFTPEHGTYWEAADQDESEDAENKSSSSSSSSSASTSTYRLDDGAGGFPDGIGLLGQESGAVARVPSAAVKTRGLDASKFACQLSGSIGPPSGENEKIAKVLEDIADGYDTRNHQHDQYRVKEYKKLSAMVAKFPTPLRRAKDLLSTVGKISEKMLKRVDEIIESGKSGGILTSPILDSFDGPRQRAIQELKNVHGFGPYTAKKLVSAGVVSMAELRRRMACSATSKNPADRLPIELSDAQRVGISRYEDLLLRMPRFEVAAIGQLVREHAKQICPGIEVVVCGSYRRGKSMSGDVDVLLAPPPGAEDFCDLESSGLRHTVLPRLLSSLRDSGFITDSLTAHDNEPTPRGAKASFMGVCRLPSERLQAAQAAAVRSTCTREGAREEEEEEEEEDYDEEVDEAFKIDRRTQLETSDETSTETLLVPRHRRLDIKAYPRKAFPFALLYFTGCGHFNRSMRLWAKKHGLQLNDDGLFPRSLQERTKQSLCRYNKPETLPCQPCPPTGFHCESEEEIFAALSLTWREPTERNVFDVKDGAVGESAEVAAAHRRQKRPH
jgi:DNA polymerase/3'-5' exonuclease PolX